MNILIVSRALPVHSFGGMEVNSLGLARHLSLLGHRVSLVTTAHPDHPAEDWLQPQGSLTIRYLGNTVCGRYSRAFDVRLRRLVSEMLDQGALDLVHSHNSAAASLHRSKLLRPFGIPHLVTWHGIHSHWITNSVSAALRGQDVIENLREAGRDFWQWMHRDLWLSRGADRVVAQDSKMEFLIRCHFLISKRRIARIGTGIDAERFRPGSVETAPSGFRMLAAGRFQPQKGFADVIEAVALLSQTYPEIHLDLAGDGPLRGALVQLVAERRLTTRVTFSGHLSHDELPGIYQRCQMFVNASTHEDGYNTVLLEAMACGCPVVATATAGTREIIMDGLNGKLVPKRRPAAIAAAAAELYESAGLRQKLGDQARATVERNCSWNAIAKQTEFLYANVLSFKNIQPAERGLCESQETE